MELHELPAPPNFHEPFLEKQKDTKETYHIYLYKAL